ncbi:PREDICTED: uncharacterized protein LOC105586897 isoform X5 [Cercocebus atys]|uniref:uncharacterized protein LOC105586897 isoform X5 n=1 Tax=Cercocebus atys TaxID=9531 RepID=UPI0005F50EAE|nr:PREDICTED: uncharacterized protein LOC105586897 isoform X5 [Cercocebus atys]
MRSRDNYAGSVHAAPGLYHSLSLLICCHSVRSSACDFLSLQLDLSTICTYFPTQEECLHSNPSQDTVYFGSHLVAKSKREKKQTVGEDVSRTLSLDHPKTESDGSFLMPPRDSCFSEEEYCMLAWVKMFKLDSPWKLQSTLPRTASPHLVLERRP